MLEQLRIKLAQYLQNKLQNYVKNKNPDFTVGRDYLRRWWIIPRNPIFNIYYHNFKVSDDDRAKHCHMYFNLSFILKGAYIEHTTEGSYIRKVGDIKVRAPWTLHRIELGIPNDIPGSNHVWTLFITGPRIRE